MGAPGQHGGLGLGHTAPTGGSQSPPLCHQAEVFAVAGEFSLGREEFLLRWGIVVGILVAAIQAVNRE